MRVPDQNIEISPISLLNIYGAFKVAKRIFPSDCLDIGIRYLSMQLPKSVMTWANAALSPIRLSHMTYYIAKEKVAGRIVGITGLYAVEGKNEAWVGWFGVAPDARGHGYGSQLLDWTIQTAKDEGFDTLRLWTSTSELCDRANELYDSRNFDRRELGVADTSHPSKQLIVRSLSLNGQSTHAFNGSLHEALLGESPKRIAEGRRIYEARRQPANAVPPFIEPQ